MHTHSEWGMRLCSEFTSPIQTHVQKYLSYICHQWSVSDDLQININCFCRISFEIILVFIRLLKPWSAKSLQSIYRIWLSNGETKKNVQSVKCGVEAIINKWRKWGTTETLPRTGHPFRTDKRWKRFGEAAVRATATLRELQECLASTCYSLHVTPVLVFFTCLVYGEGG